MRLCIVCKTRLAAVPDRMVTGRRINKICKECHSDRLRSDLRAVIAANINRYQRAGDIDGN